MVTYELIAVTDKTITYNYYPEGKKETCGIISIDLVKEEMVLEKPSENDVLINLEKDDLNQMRDEINRMRAENGESLLTEEELPVAKEDSSYYVYATHAIKDICDKYNNGNTPENGTVMWY